jgi:hypothetical protein
MAPPPDPLKEVGQVFDPRGDWATTRHGISRGVPGMEEPPLESKGAKKKKKKPKPAGAGPAADSDEDEARILKTFKGLYIMTLHRKCTYLSALTFENVWHLFPFLSPSL